LQTLSKKNGCDARLHLSNEQARCARFALALSSAFGKSILQVRRLIFSLTNKKKKGEKRV